MGHAWIVGVLDDIRTYAELNGLDDLAASIVAAGLAAEAAQKLDRMTAQKALLGASLGGASGRRERSGLGPRLAVDRGLTLAR